jgi:hypothetical protein
MVTEDVCGPFVTISKNVAVVNVLHHSILIVFVVDALMHRNHAVHTAIKNALHCAMQQQKGAQSFIDG